MTDKSTPPTRRKSAPTKRAPGWIAPVIAAVLCAGLTWGVGMSIFRGTLENRGLPEEIRDSSAVQRQFWQYGSTVAGLSAQAKALAALTQGDSSRALNQLAATLDYGAQLTGELSFDDQPEVVLATKFTPARVSELAAQVTALSTELPEIPAEQAPLAPELAKLAFQSNLEARTALKTVAATKEVAQLAVPLIAGKPDTQGEPVGCLADQGLLDPASEISDPSLNDDVQVARALDRGYALDYTLQLLAARGPSQSAAQVEERRTKLNAQLRSIRSVLTDGCADLRQPAYILPKDGLQDLNAVVANAEEDFAQQVVLASGASTDRAQDTLAASAWQVLQARQQRGAPTALLEPGK